MPRKNNNTIQGVSPRTFYPPVFVMNLYYTGLGIARSLHPHGVKVYGLSSRKDAPGMKSRYFQGIYEVPDGSVEPEALCQRLLELKDCHDQPPVIFPTRDLDVLFLHENREQLTPFFRILQPPGDAIPNILDKFEATKIARTLDIPVPNTVICRSKEDIEEKIHLLQFPLVVKPRFAYQWRQLSAWKKVGARKAFLVKSYEELLIEYRQLNVVTPEILLQEYVPGPDPDIVMCCCYINKSGELEGYFTAKKLRQNPPIFGTGCVVEAVSIPEILEPSVEFLNNCKYTGLAEIEYKHHKHSDKFYLIEVNPRHWDQHLLGNLLGVNLTWLAFQDIISSNSTLQLPAYSSRSPTKWIAERELILLLLHKAFSPITSQLYSEKKARKDKMLNLFPASVRTFREFISLLRGRKVFGIFDFSDPAPFLLLVIRFLKEIILICKNQLMRLKASNTIKPAYKDNLTF